MFCIPTKTPGRRAFSTSSGLKSVIKKLRSRAGFVWTVNLVPRAFPLKVPSLLPSREKPWERGWWTVGLIVEIPLSFQISAA